MGALSKRPYPSITAGDQQFYQAVIRWTFQNRAGQNSVGRKDKFAVTGLPGTP